MLLHSPLEPLPEPPPEPQYESPLDWYSLPDARRAEQVRNERPEAVELFAERLPFWYCRLYRSWTGEVGDDYTAKKVDFRGRMGTKMLYYRNKLPDLVQVQTLINCYRPQPLQGVLVKYRPEYSGNDMEYIVEWFAINA